jgi:DNA-binding IclR family transcriptional regulator
MKEFCLIVWGAHHGRTSRKTARLVGSDWKIDGGIGLSEVARAVDFDKATTLRLLSPLAANGMVEKLEPIHRNRIGPMVLHLAGKREAIVPFAQSARPILEALSVEVQESSHLTEPSAGEMVIPLAVNCGALDVETCSVAAPILRSDGIARAGLSIAAPTNRACRRALDLLALRVVSAAGKISKSLD